MKEAVIVAGARTPVTKANKGALKNVRPEDLAAFSVKETLKRANMYDGYIDDVIFGTAMPEAEQGLNISRNISALAGVRFDAPAITINRYCSSGLQSIAYAAEKIQLGQAKAIIAGGVESMSMVPMTGNTPRFHHKIVDDYPEYYTSMGQTAENVAIKYNISREKQDVFALNSHKKAYEAQISGKFDDEIVPIHYKLNTVVADKLRTQIVISDKDDGIRINTNLETLGKLKPAFRANGTVTAGNSSQTSDGGASVLVMEKEYALSLGLKPLAKFKAFSVAGVRPEYMGIGPIEAIPRVLNYLNLSMKDIGLFELNEAFAAQSIAVIEQLGLDENIVNVNGGAIALGHPLGCTGTKLSISLINEMRRRNVQFGMVTMCIGGGMGAAGIFELIN
ncbi:MAG: acetyl-CoA acetyltransferase [Bacillales bacterium]|nr:acetyl-CoA acetyltransferase [Bacillales bacterium]